jgi:hypothetical protein
MRVDALFFFPFVMSCSVVRVTSLTLCGVIMQYVILTGAFRHPVSAVSQIHFCCVPILHTVMRKCFFIGADRTDRVPDNSLLNRESPVSSAFSGISASVYQTPDTTALRPRQASNRWCCRGNAEESDTVPWPCHVVPTACLNSIVQYSALHMLCINNFAVTDKICLDEKSV